MVGASVNGRKRNWLSETRNVGRRQLYDEKPRRDIWRAKYYATPRGECDYIGELSSSSSLLLVCPIVSFLTKSKMNFKMRANTGREGSNCEIKKKNLKTTRSVPRLIWREEIRNSLRTRRRIIYKTSGGGGDQTVRSEGRARTAKYTNGKFFFFIFKPRAQQ